MNVDTFTSVGGVGAIGFGLFVVIWSILRIWLWFYQRSLRRKENDPLEAFYRYVETGRWSEPLDHVGDAAVQAAGRARALRVVQKGWAVQPFTAVCPCPHCGCLGLHWLTDHHPITNEIARQCIECGCNWTQKAL